MGTSWTKAMFKTPGNDENMLEGIREQVALVMYEFKEGEMVIFEQGAWVDDQAVTVL